MEADQSGILQRIDETKEELWKVRQQLDHAIRDPERNEEDIQNLLTAHSAVAFEYKALLKEKSGQMKQLLESLKEHGVIDDYAVVKEPVQLRMGTVEVALEQDELFPYLRGLVQGRRHAHQEEVDVEGIEFPEWMR